jgi:hypothetical protein
VPGCFMGNSAPSLVSRCQSLSLQCGEFVDKYNLATMKTRRGLFGNRRPLASPRQWPNWGCSHLQTGGPFFAEQLLQRCAET